MFSLIERERDRDRDKERKKGGESEREKERMLPEQSRNIYLTPWAYGC